MQTLEHEPVDVELSSGSADGSTGNTDSVEGVEPAASAAPPSETLLELVEVELAVGLADIKADGFEQTMRAALAAAGGTLLFILPGGGDEVSVAAVSLGSGAQRDTFLAILEADGSTVRFEPAGASSHPVAGLASSWTRVMERMPAIAA